MRIKPRHGAKEGSPGRRCLAAGALVAVVMVVAAGGCGGDSGEADKGGFEVRADTTMSTAEGLTGAELARLVNRACRRKWPTILANFAQVAESPPPQYRDGHRYATTVRISFTAGLDFHIFDEIHDLGAPPGEERRLSELLGAMQEPVETTQQGLAPIRTPAQLEAHFAQYNSLARAYGLSDCLVAGAHLPPSFDPLPDG